MHWFVVCRSGQRHQRLTLAGALNSTPERAFSNAWSSFLPPFRNATKKDKRGTFVGLLLALALFQRCLIKSQGRCHRWRQHASQCHCRCIRRQRHMTPAPALRHHQRRSSHKDLSLTCAKSLRNLYQPLLELACS